MCKDYHMIGILTLSFVKAPFSVKHFSGLVWTAGLADNLIKLPYQITPA